MKPSLDLFSDQQAKDERSEPDRKIDPEPTPSTEVFPGSRGFADQSRQLRSSPSKEVAFLERRWVQDEQDVLFWVQVR